MKSVSICRNKCNPNWQTQYAYLENISNNKPENQIHIHDYLNDQNLMLQVKNKQKEISMRLWSSINKLSVKYKKKSFQTFVH